MRGERAVTIGVVLMVAMAAAAVLNRIVRRVNVDPRQSPVEQ
jgi:hypothetical protein